VTLAPLAVRCHQY